MKIQVGKIVLAVVLLMSVGVRAQLVTDGLYLHLAADDLTLADGAYVESWIDSVSANELTGSAIYEASYTNGHAAVLFNGSDDILHVTNLTNSPNTASITMFVVGGFLSVPTSTAADYMISGSNLEPDWGGDPSGDNRLRLAAVGSDWRTRVGDGSNRDSGGDIADTDFHVFSVVSGQDASSMVYLRVDGTQVASGSHGVTANCLDLSLLNLGGFFNFPNDEKDFANCRIAEVLIYDGALADAQIAQVNTYLSDKYAITLDPPIAPVWNVDPINDTASVGESYTNILSNFVTAPNKDSITYAKTAGPDWLNVETNGIATGDPLLANLGTNTFTVTADDGLFDPVPVVLNIVVTDPQVPSGATLYLHLVADDLVLADGDPVESWIDSVGANELTGSATYKADYTNGHAAVRFNGSSDLLSVKNLTGPDTASITAFVVGNFNAVLSSTDYMMSCQALETDWGGDPSGDNRLRLAVANTAAWRTRVGDGSNRDSAVGMADTDLHVFSIVSGQGGTSAVKLLVDRTPVSSGTHGVTSNCLDLCSVNLGGFHNAISAEKDWADCHVAEVRIYDGAMTDFEIDAINQELHDKYFVAYVPVPVEDLKIAGPVSGGTAMELSWTGVAGKPYSVETNSNLIVGDWQSWMTSIIGNGSITVITNTIGSDETFYRVITEDE